MLSTAARVSSSIAKSAGALRELATSTMIRQTQLLIDGKFVDAVSGKTFETINPATEEVLANVAEADAADVDKAVAAAKKAFRGPWRSTPPHERARIMMKFADLMEANIDELATLESLDSGKPYSVARNVELPMAVQGYRYYAGWADKIVGKTIPMATGDFAFTRRHPIGVCAAITPWNFPILMTVWKLGPALAAGNTCVLKPAEQTPLTALRIGELFLEAGLPPGVLNVIPGFGHSAGANLSKHPDVDKVAFTGSTDVGFKIAEAAHTGRLRRLTLELGGSSPNIIFSDADLDMAVDQAFLGLFLNMGQCCVAGSRIFVENKIYDAFVEKAVAKAKARKVGDPMASDTDQGPQISKLQMNKILGYIERGQAAGAKLHCGGKRIDSKGWFVEPTIFSEVTNDMEIAQDEVFGPVMTLIRFDEDDLSTLMHLANDTKYGLGAGIVTRDMERALRVADELDVGTVYVNTYNIFSPQVPFGGFKDSGLGRELGEAALNNYLEDKTVIINTDKARPFT